MPSEDQAVGRDKDPPGTNSADNPGEKIMSTSRSSRSPSTTETTSQLTSPTVPSLPPSAFRSPNSSQETSPIRPPAKPTVVPFTQRTPSRKNSQKFSPTRSAHLSGVYATTPSAAAVQRGLSAQKLRVPNASVVGVMEGSLADKGTRSGHNSPSWPISPRLKSPPPSSVPTKSSIPVPRKADSDLMSPNTSVKRLTVVSAPDLPNLTREEEPGETDARSKLVLRTPARVSSVASPKLETVEEGSLPTTPSAGALLDEFVDSNSTTGNALSGELKSLDKSHAATVGSEQGSRGESDGQRTHNGKQGHASITNSSAPAKPAANLAKKSLTNLASSKGKPVEQPLRSMTVETETVSSVPQYGLVGNGERATSGRLQSNSSVRLKPSSETIRPKKEKKRTPRKPASLHSGTVSSKADIFEAKVASALDETTSSDSEETFVYESNPPESHARRGYHRSRTPSATSLASQADHYGTRNLLTARDGNHSVAGKRSMKFTNNAYNHNPEGQIVNAGSGRGSVRNGSTSIRHHHVGRYERGGHPSLFDTDSPFGQGKKGSSPKTGFGNTPRSPRLGSLRIVGGRLASNTKKAEASAYDIDGDAADDERAPLVGPVRINRSRHSRRPIPGGNRHPDYYEERQSLFWWRHGACIIVTLLFLILCLGVGTFVVALNQPLTNVSIEHIQNVLASEQEIMLDLNVRATNPNLFPITVTELDVNMFAKSGFVGTTKAWREHETPAQRSWTARRRELLFNKSISFGPVAHFKTPGGVDKGTDPIEDPEGDPQTMLLGRVFHFDSPLIFDPSPVKRQSSSYTGEIRLAKPGNKTEEGGSARWERVLQHPFDLIVRGVIKYQLPISSRLRSAALGDRVKVLPKDEADHGRKAAPKY